MKREKLDTRARRVFRCEAQTLEKLSTSDSLRLHVAVYSRDFENKRIFKVTPRRILAARSVRTASGALGFILKIKKIKKYYKEKKRYSKKCLLAKTTLLGQVKQEPKNSSSCATRYTKLRFATRISLPS